MPFVFLVLPTLVKGQKTDPSMKYYFIALALKSFGSFFQAHLTTHYLNYL